MAEWVRFVDVGAGMERDEREVEDGVGLGGLRAMEDAAGRRDVEEVEKGLLEVGGLGFKEEAGMGTGVVAAEEGFAAGCFFGVASVADRDDDGAVCGGMFGNVDGARGVEAGPGVRERRASLGSGAGSGAMSKMSLSEEEEGDGE
ncbi:hypothetical protein HDU93_005916, partial [Gonapodya sp. JEL0774]